MRYVAGGLALRARPWYSNFEGTMHVYYTIFVYKLQYTERWSRATIKPRDINSETAKETKWACQLSTSNL